jgi:hypothetical protein
MFRLLRSSITIVLSELTSDMVLGVDLRNVLGPNSNGTYALWRLRHVLAEYLLETTGPNSRTLS